MKQISVDDFVRILPSCCDEKTAYGMGWTANNPLFGHCAVVALLAQDFFGGAIMRGVLADGNRHYWNWWADRGTLDFTAAQFGNQYPVFRVCTMTSREQLLQSAYTRSRYELLKQRFIAALPEE